MQDIPAENLMALLKQDTNRSRFKIAPVTEIWFSTQIPPELPIGQDREVLAREKILQTSGGYFTVQELLSSWMTFWQHRGGYCWAATAFVSIMPLNENIPMIEFELVKAPAGILQNDSSMFLYGFEHQRYLTSLMQGLKMGFINAYQGGSITDIRIRILNAISDRVDSAPLAFETLGNWLSEAMVSEFEKRGWIIPFQIAHNS